jgi:hypothetical protein
MIANRDRIARWDSIWENDLKFPGREHTADYAIRIHIHAFIPSPMGHRLIVLRIASLMFPKGAIQNQRRTIPVGIAKQFISKSTGSDGYLSVGSEECSTSYQHHN